MDDLIPVHPETVDDDDRLLRWVMPPSTLRFVGAPQAVPDDVQALIDDGTLVAVDVEPSAIRTRLADGFSWRNVGGRVREALQSGLADPDAWVPPRGADVDDVLRSSVEEVMAGEVGDYIRSHGGRIELVSITGDRVEVALHGACAHCPASDTTLAGRITTALRQRCPAVKSVVRHVGEPAGSGGPAWLKVLPTRRDHDRR